MLKKQDSVVAMLRASPTSSTIESSRSPLLTGVSLLLFLWYNLNSMNGEVILGILLFAGAILGISFLIALAIEKYNQSKHKHSYGRKENNNNADGEPKIKKTPERDYSIIEAEINDVVRWIGVSEPVNTSEMFEKVLDGKEKEVIDEIAEQLSLPMKITTKYCPDKKYNDDGSTDLAEVKVGNIPHYGSKHLKDYPCTITLYPGYNQRSDRFIYVIAHELCHYVLQSLRPRLSDAKKEERQTDLAVIFGGFESAYRTGWQSLTNGNAGYYLDETEINYIRRRYESMLAERRQKVKKISAEYKTLLGDQADTLLFIRMCKLLLEHPDEKIESSDTDAINRCFAIVGKKEIEKIYKLNTALKPYLKKKTRYGETKQDEESLAELTKLLKGVGLPAMGEITILMKYANKYK